MDDIVEGLFHFIVRTLLAIVRLLIWFTWEIMCTTVLWYVGWPVMRVVTLGYLPEQAIGNSEDEKPLVFMAVVIVGFSSLLFMAAMLAGYVN